MTDQLLTGNNLDITITLQEDGTCEIKKSSEGGDKIDVTLQHVEIGELQKLLDLVRMQKSNTSQQIVISEVSQKIQNIASATSPEELKKAIADIGDIKQYADSMTDDQATASYKPEQSKNKEGGGKYFDIKLHINIDNINNIDNLAQSLNNVLESNLTNLESLKTILQNNSDNKEEQREVIKDLLNKKSSSQNIDEQNLDAIVTIITSLTSDVLSSLLEKLSETTKEQSPSNSPQGANAKEIQQQSNLSKKL